MERILPAHLNPKTLARQRTPGDANRLAITQTGGGHFNGTRLLEAAKSVLKGTRRRAVIEKIAYQGAAITVKLIAEEGENDWAEFLSAFLDFFRVVVKERVAEYGATSFWPEIFLKYRQGCEPGEVKYRDGFLQLNRSVIFPGDNIDSELSGVGTALSAKNENYQNMSNLVIDEIRCGVIQISNYSPLSAGLGYVELPVFLKNKKAIINVQNKDNRCFGYAILSWWKAKDTDGRVPHIESQWCYKEEDFQELGLDKLSYPVKPEDTRLMEEQLHTKINVYTYNDDEGKMITPFYYSRYEGESIGHVNLLFFREHWAWIRNFSRFAAKTHYAGNCQRYWCTRCLNSFLTQSKLEEHTMYCRRPDYCEKVQILSSTIEM